MWQEFNPDGSAEIEYDEFIEYFGKHIQGKMDGGVADKLQSSAVAQLAGDQDVFEDKPRYRPKPKVEKVDVLKKKPKKKLADLKPPTPTEKVGQSMEDAAMEMKVHPRTLSPSLSRTLSRNLP